MEVPRQKLRLRKQHLVSQVLAAPERKLSVGKPAREKEKPDEDGTVLCGESARTTGDGGRVEENGPRRRNTESER